MSFEDMYGIEKAGTPLNSEQRNHIANSILGYYGKMDVELATIFSSITEESEFDGGMESKLSVFVKAEPGTEINGLHGKGPIYTASPTISELIDILKNDKIIYVKASHTLRYDV